MKNNLIQNKVKVAATFLFLLISIFLVKKLVTMNNTMDKQSIDVKLGQLSDTNTDLTVTQGVAVSAITRHKKNTSNSTVPVPITSVAGTSNAEACGLTLSFKLDKATFTQDVNSNYTMYVKNEGAQKCPNASVSVYYSDNQSFVSSVPKASASNYYWVLGDMDPGVSKTISFSTVYKEGDISSTSIQTDACATADDSEDACASITSNLINSENVTNAPVATVPVSVLPATAPVVPNASFDPGTREYGTWVWTSPYAMSSTYRDIVIAGAVANKINVIYVTIDDYLTIDSLAAGTTKEAKKAKYTQSLESFIALANKNNIQVDVEAGWRDWAEEPNTNKANIIIDYSIAYNNSHSNKIRSVQFDVEPYLLSSYEQNKASVLTNFVKFVGGVSNRLGSNKLGLTIVIPHFYDSVQSWTPAILYNGIKDYTFSHILKILDTRQGSSIILMSYRNTALGEDGSIKISKAEIDQASAGGHSTKVIVGQETGNVEPSYVTFYQKTKEYYLSQINTINNEFKNKSNFGGISVHYIDPFLDLR